jgi:thiamine kinase-like enzyme
VKVQGIVARIWPDVRPEVQPLGGGITNHNFKVTLDGEAFVLRIGGKDTELLGIAREVEQAASRAAAELGIGPEVVRFLEPEGYLVTRFVHGREIPPREMRTPPRIRLAAETLRRFHEADPIPGRFDSFRVVETYRETAERHGVSAPDDYGWAKEQADRIEDARAGAEIVPCHNDLLNANFILDGDRLWLVDWEYAGMGDRFFDLANFSINHELGDEENEALLEAYFGAVRADDARALRLMRFMSDFREAMWGVVQQGISELDFDFREYATEHFDRLRRTASEPAFKDALAG